MYAKRTQILNYGPISHLDIEFPFQGQNPKPVLLVGENGSGKSISLSFIVNALVTAKDLLYPESQEVSDGKAFKIRRPSYIRTGYRWSFARVDFEHDLFFAELTLDQFKRDFPEIPSDMSSEPVRELWNSMPDHLQSHLHSNFRNNNLSKVRQAFAETCVQYFPPDRFDEPAWLNREDLNVRADYMSLTHILHHTSRRMINYSTLNENQKWLFDLLFDRVVRETRTATVPMPIHDSDQKLPLPIQIGPSGDATNAYQVAVQIMQQVISGHPDAWFNVGGRLNRVFSLQSSNGIVVPNIFQLSSGETSLLSLFLSILRDFDLTNTTFGGADQVRGIVVIDEIDLRLHAVHQHEVLPGLIRMFPKVQFIMTTHSPLFVLGMSRAFGEDGFALYRLPQGLQISPEEFSEFGAAYQTFRQTSRFSDDVRQAVKDTERPIVYVEGSTDIQYLRKAADLLHQQRSLNGVDLKDGQGDKLKSTWETICKLPDELVPRPIIVVRDCDFEGPPANEGNRHRRTIPKQDHHPVSKGIENLFSKATIEEARIHDPAFIDIRGEQPVTIRGEAGVVPEQWAVNKDEKTNLCNWLCENGTAEDFQHFQVIFDLLEELLPAGQAT